VQRAASRPLFFVAQRHRIFERWNPSLTRTKER
jgi:hypothetical protein